MEENTQNENTASQEHQMILAGIKDIKQTIEKQGTPVVPTTQHIIYWHPILITVVIVVAVIFVLRKMKSLKGLASNLIATNDKISQKFVERLCKGVEDILSGQFPAENIAKIKDFIRNDDSAFLDIQNLERIDYTITRKDAATANIELSIVIKKETNFTRLSTKWNCDFDFLPNELNEAYIKSYNKSVTRVVYKKETDR